MREKLSAKQYGINEFSVLNCFCATHDNKLFAHVEDDPLVFDAHQLTLLHYRTLASELYRKVASYHTVLYQVEAQQKKTPRDKEATEFLTASAAGNLLGIRDVGTAFDRCANNLFAKKYDDISALVVHFKKLPSVMTVGSFLPQYDYDAKPLQLIHDPEILAQTVSFNILASQDHAALAMLWFKDCNLIKPLAESFIAQESEHYTTLAIQTAFEYLENTCMQPTWWEGEKQVVQNLLIERMQRAGTPFEERKAACLTFCGVGFDQWDYSHHEFLSYLNGGTGYWASRRASFLVSSLAAERRPGSSRSRKYPSACPVASFAMKQASLLSSNRPGRREAVRTSARHLPDGTVVIG